MVPTLSLTFIIFDLVLGFVLPVLLTILFIKKYNVKLSTILIGAATMILFAFILEQIVHKIVLGSSTIAPYMTRLGVYVIYGSLMAGLFEETGRFLTMKFVLKNKLDNNNNALAYGIGHGGVELLILLGIGMINNLVYSVMINTGTISAVTSALNPEQTAQFNAAVNQLITTSPWLFLVSLLERLFALTAQLSLSVIVWYAVKNGGKAFWFYPLAILLHAILDAVAVVVNKHIGIVASECCVFAMTVAIVSIAFILWNKARNCAVEQ